MGDYLAWLVRGCEALGPPAAHAAIPFVMFFDEVYTARNDTDTALIAAARRALEAIDKLGPHAGRSGRLREFHDLAEEHPF